MAISKKSKRNSSATACRTTHAKAAGTRLGTYQDWRGASGKSGKLRSERRSAFRDGR